MSWACVDSLMKRVFLKTLTVPCIFKYKKKKIIRGDWKHVPMIVEVQESITSRKQSYKYFSPLIVLVNRNTWLGDFFFFFKNTLFSYDDPNDWKVLGAWSWHLVSLWSCITIWLGEWGRSVQRERPGSSCFPFITTCFCMQLLMKVRTHSLSWDGINSFMRKMSPWFKH